MLFLLWALYLSLCAVSGPFLNFQWDTLLLETGFLAIFFAPLQLWERPSRQTGRRPWCCGFALADVPAHV
jgi:hypothetical protein